LGIKVLELKNKYPLSKWIFKILMKKGYGKNSFIINTFIRKLSQVSARPTGSPFWKVLMKVKK
jgi:hypothetical protein